MQHYSHCSSEKLLFAADGDHSIKLQLVKMQKTTDHVVPCPSGYIYNTTLAFKIWEMPQKMGWEDCESQDDREICCEIVSLRYDKEDKPMILQSMASYSTSRLMWKRESYGASPLYKEP